MISILLFSLLMILLIWAVNKLHETDKQQMDKVNSRPKFTKRDAEFYYWDNYYLKNKNK